MRILIMFATSRSLYNFKKEFIEELITPKKYLNENELINNSVIVCVPDKEFNSEFEKMGCEVVNINIDRRGKNPFSDLKLMLDYINVIKKVNPDVVMTFNIKPNIYGGLASIINKKKYITSITGLGTTIRSKTIITPLIKFMYRISSYKSNYIYFENQSDLEYFNENIFKNKVSKLMPGSGINLNKFRLAPYNMNSNKVKFITVARIMRDKGISELLDAAEIIKNKHNNVEFYLVGEYEEESYRKKIEKLNNIGIINYLGFRENISELIKNSDCLIHPSYHEGLSNVLLEAAASGRPVIASNVAGCKETFVDGETGISIESRNTNSLVNGIEKFLKLSKNERKKMGLLARDYVENNFDRKIAIKIYIEDLNSIKNI